MTITDTEATEPPPAEPCDIKVRFAALEDMPACAMILNNWIDETPWMPRVHNPADVVRHYRETVFPYEQTLVARQGEILLGFCTLSGENYISALYIAPAGRGRGIGKRLVDRARSLAPEGLRLWTFQANDGARRFYAREGFREVRRTEGDNEEKLPDILLEWKPEGRHA